MMQPVGIDIDKAEHPQLRDECERLGLGPERARSVTLRKKLRNYQQVYRRWEKYCRLATMLFGVGHGINTTTLDLLVDGIHDRLYRRLYDEGHILVLLAHEDDTAQAILARPSIVDTVNNQLFFITGRQTRRVVDTLTKIPGTNTVSKSAHNILFAARMTFKDVKLIYRLWETGESEA
jgi:hypothetical protein